MSCFFAGICNLTEKFTHQFGTETSYHSSKRVYTTIQVINQSFQKLQTFNCQVHFATIPPVSLTSYINFQQKQGILRKSIHQLEHISYQQKSLENDIVQINEDICKLNTFNGTSAIRLLQRCHKLFYKETWKKFGQSYKSSIFLI